LEEPAAASFSAAAACRCRWWSLLMPDDDEDDMDAVLPRLLMLHVLSSNISPPAGFARNIVFISTPSTTINYSH
jgi:hypothetical protein